MSKKPKYQKVKCELSYLDLDNMKEMCRAILHTNIAVKNFQMPFCETCKQKEMMTSSIQNSKEALTKLDNIKNVETINMIIMKAVGQNSWVDFIQTLGGFSGSLNDQRLYDWDNNMSKIKAEKTLGGKA